MSLRSESSAFSCTAIQATGWTRCGHAVRDAILDVVVGNLEIRPLSSRKTFVILCSWPSPQHTQFQLAGPSWTSLALATLRLSE